MIASIPLNASYSVASQLSAADIGTLARAGFATIINFRPDDEADGQLASLDAQRAARAAGLQYFYIPTAKFNVFADTVVSEAAAALATAPGPILGYCASGQRAAIVWAAATARTVPVDHVLTGLELAGFDLSFLRDDLEAQAGRVHWNVDHATARIKPELANA